MKTVFARHCQTDYNAQGRIQGQTDTELNAVGIGQARDLAEKVSGCGIDLIITSDLKRAVQTAGIVAEKVGTLIIADASWRECSFGSLDGTTFAEFGMRCGFRNLGSSDPLHNDFTPFGGERGMDVFRRQKEALDGLKKWADSRTVMIIGHGRSLRNLLGTLGYPTMFLWKQGTFLAIDY